jgi:hypothetical protein
MASDIPTAAATIKKLRIAFIPCHSNVRPYERDPARTSNKLSAITSALAIKRYGYRPDGRFCTDGGNCIYLYHGGRPCT